MHVKKNVATLRVVYGGTKKKEKWMYRYAPSGWRTLNFNTQPLSELAKAVVMAIRAALNAASLAATRFSRDY